MSERRAVIFDLDNTIADDGWRIPRIEWSADSPIVRYHNYHLLAAFDEVGNQELLEGLDVEDIDVYIFTARPMIYQAITTEWLERKGILYKALFMRPDEDHDKSVDLKKRQLFNLFANFDVQPSDIIAAYDDREDVVKMYQDHNVAGKRVCIHNVCAYTDPVGRKK